MNVYEMIAFIAYFVLVIGVGIYFFFKSKGNAGEKDYFLGGRDMNGLVAALSAGASDMSAWVLMGLPGHSMRQDSATCGYQLVCSSEQHVPGYS